MLPHQMSPADLSRNTTVFRSKSAAYYRTDFDACCRVTTLPGHFLALGLFPAYTIVLQVGKLLVRGHGATPIVNVRSPPIMACVTQQLRR